MSARPKRAKAGKIAIRIPPIRVAVIDATTSPDGGHHVDSAICMMFANQHDLRTKLLHLADSIGMARNIGSGVLVVGWRLP